MLSSLIFYAWGEPANVFLMAGSILIGYFLGRLMEKSHSKFWLVLGCVIYLGVLGYFKYANFIIENINALTGINKKMLSISLPVGISFYTFQMLSYLVDVYRKDVKAQKNVITLATYITMFPQLIAGPIVRYSDVEKELEVREHSMEKAVYGIRRFVLGLGKKVLLANLLAEFCQIFREVDDRSILFYWAYAVSVSMQIYFDFSGYSDMAIGLGKIFGFHFGENFDYPFISKSITEFWRRWHISLGNWFRDYVYISLGGNRQGRVKWIRNLLLVWMLTGLWHGAQWNFVLWGLLFGILLILEKLFYYDWLKKKRIIGHLYTLLIVLISFVLFDSESVSVFLANVGAMFGAGGLPLFNQTTRYYLSSYGMVFLLAILFATPLPKYLVNKIRVDIRAEIEPVVMILILITCTAYLVDGSFNPFLYFRF